MSCSTTGLEFDTIIVSTAALKAERFKHYGPRIHCTALTGCESAELNQTFEWLAQTQDQTPVASWGLVLAGEAGTAENTVGWAEEKAQSNLGPNVKVLGHIDSSVDKLPLHSGWQRWPELTAKLSNHLLIH